MFSSPPSGPKNSGWDSKGALVSKSGGSKHPRQGIPEWRCPVWRRQRRAVTGRLFPERCLNRPDDQGSEGYPFSQLTLEGMDFSELFSWAPRLVAGYTAPENKTCSVTENPSPLASLKADWSHWECLPWFLWALERSEMSACTTPCCETCVQKIRELCHWWLQHPDPASFLIKVATRRCQKSAPLTPPPSHSFTSKNMNQALKRAVSEGWFSCDYCLGETLCLVFLQTALFAEQNTLGSCPIDTFFFKEQIQLQSEMQI